MTDLLPSMKPTHAVTCWCDDRYVYVEIPSKVPYLAKFPLSEAGMSKALNLLRTRYEEAPTHEKNYMSLPKGYVAETLAGKGPTYRRQPKKVQTEAERDHALSVLRKLGIV